MEQSVLEKLKQRFPGGEIDVMDTSGALSGLSLCDQARLTSHREMRERFCDIGGA